MKFKLTNRAKKERQRDIRNCLKNKGYYKLRKKIKEELPFELGFYREVKTGAIIHVRIGVQHRIFIQAIASKDVIYSSTEIIFPKFNDVSKIIMFSTTYEYTEQILKNGFVFLGKKYFRSTPFMSFPENCKEIFINEKEVRELCNNFRLICRGDRFESEDLYGKDIKRIYRKIKDFKILKKAKAHIESPSGSWFCDPELKEILKFNDDKVFYIKIELKTSGILRLTDYMKK